MDSLENLLALARTGYFKPHTTTPNTPPLTGEFSGTTTPNTPPDTDTAAEGACHLWLIRAWGRRFIVSFNRPRTLQSLQQQAATKQPDVAFEFQALEPFVVDVPPHTRPLPDNGTQDDTLQQQPLLDAPIETKADPTAAGELLARAGVSVRYVAEKTDAERVIGKLLALSDNGISWGLDIETAPTNAFKRDHKAGLDPYKATIRLLQVYPGGDTCYVFDVRSIGLSVLKELLNTRRFAAHNAVFELKHLLHSGVTPPRMDCTLLQDNALFGGRRPLVDVAKERLGWSLNKALQVSDWTADTLSPEQLEYAALDAVVAYKLAFIQADMMQQKALTRCYTLMRDAQMAIARLELNGCPFDVSAHTLLVAQWQAAAEAARGELDSLMPGVNPDSPAQLAKWLVANLPSETLEAWPKTASGQLATDADALAGLTLHALEPLTRYKVAVKRLSTYGTSYVKHVSPVTGRIHPSFLIGGTATGRLSCNNPNIQNPPRDSSFRALFAPPQGRCLVVADYGQIELRVAALVSGDVAMLEAFERGDDLHRKTAAAFLKKPPELITKAERQIAKGINFGMLFGSGARGLQAFCKSSYGVELSIEQAEKARAAFFATYPQLAFWQKRTRGAAEKVKQVRTPGGRCRALEKNIGTECLNTPIQGGAAEVMLATLAALSLPKDAQLVNIVHDELVVECDTEQAVAVQAEVERAMVSGFLTIFPSATTRGLVEARSGANWSAAKG